MRKIRANVDVLHDGACVVGIYDMPWQLVWELHEVELKHPGVLPPIIADLLRRLVTASGQGVYSTTIEG